MPNQQVDWPSAWTSIDLDPIEPGCNAHRNVVQAYYAFDSNYLFLRLENIDLAGEFILMAATLIHIKSRMLLPPDPLAFRHYAAWAPAARRCQHHAAQPQSYNNYDPTAGRARE
jgi:hypothetical protein